jgi:hypothetical protein
MQVPTAPVTQPAAFVLYKSFPQQYLGWPGKKEVDDAYVHAIDSNFVIICPQSADCADCLTQCRGGVSETPRFNPVHSERTQPLSSKKAGIGAIFGVDETGTVIFNSSIRGSSSADSGTLMRSDITPTGGIATPKAAAHAHTLDCEHLPDFEAQLKAQLSRDAYSRGDVLTAIGDVDVYRGE